MTPDEIVKRFETLWGQRKTVEETWQAIELLVAPYKGKFFRESPTEHGIEWNRRNIYDSTAVMAHISLASSIHGSLTNPALMWFDMQWRDNDLRTNHAAATWLENAAKRVYDELQDSNFNLEVNHAYRNLTSFGTAFITQEPKADVGEQWDGLNFTSVPLKQAYFEPGAYGNVKNFYRHIRWKASQIVDKFGLDKCPEKIKTLYESAADTEVSIIFCAYCRHDKQDQTDRMLTPENRPWGWCYVGRDDKHCYDKGGYYEMPAFAPRWDTVDESIWGQSPAMIALADIMTLNQLVELDLAAREKAVDPTILADQRALLSDLDLGAGKINTVRDVDKIRPFESAARFDATDNKIMDLRLQVQKYFYIDQLEMKESPAMTATEVQVRYELMQRLLSSTLSQLKEDLLDPLLQRTFNLLYRAGELGDVPAIVSEQAPEFDIQYVGPLSRSQRFDQSASIERWVTQLQLMAQSGPAAEAVLMVPDWDEIARDAARQLNLPTEYTRSKDDVEEEMRAQQEAQQRQQNAEAAQAEAAAIKDLGQAEQLRQGEQGLGGQAANT